MLASSDLVGVVVPTTDVSTSIELCCIIYEEVTMVPIGTCAFTHAFSIKFDGAVGRESHRD